MGSFWEQRHAERTVFRRREYKVGILFALIGAFLVLFSESYKLVVYIGVFFAFVGLCMLVHAWQYYFKRSK